MKTLIAFVLGISVSWAWNNADTIRGWINSNSPYSITIKKR